MKGTIMKAYVLHGINDLRYEEVPVPELRPGWALVRVMAAGICSSDIPRVFTKGTYHFPTIPGHEFAGAVEHVCLPSDGPVHPSVSEGCHVSVFPLIPCRHCDPCRHHQYEMCEHYDYIGSRRDGAFAEYAAVPVWNLVPIPDDLPFEEAAMMEPLAVALHAVRRGSALLNAESVGPLKGNPLKGNTVGIVGSGMIGFAAALWAKALGASRAAVIGRSEDKREIAEQIGVEYAVLPVSSSPLPQFDLVIEAVGTPACVAEAVRLARPGGGVVLMGNPSGDIALPQDVYWRILRKQLRITGTWNSSYESFLQPEGEKNSCRSEASDWGMVRDALIRRTISVKPLITHCFDRDHVADGLRLMHEHREPYCKVMTLWGPDRRWNDPVQQERKEA